MRKIAFMDFHGTLAYKSYSDTLHQVLTEFHPDHLYTQSTFRDLLDGSYLWDNPEAEHKQLNKPEKWWEHMNGKLKEAYIQLGYKQDAEQMTARFRELYTDPNEYMVYDDAVEGVKKIRKMGWKVVILTNHMPEIKKVIKKLPFGRYISKVISSANIGYEKPNIKFYEYALKKTWHPEKCVMLGDNILADIQGATSVGIPAILVRNSLFKDNENCKYFAKDLNEAVDIIAKYF
ncbi:MAG: HAD family hydrolase [Eubacteriales bacterium]